MSSSDPRRREFLGRLAGGALTLAGGGALAPLAAASPPPPPSDAPWDESWVQRLAGAKHKAVFDAPEVANGIVLTNAFVFMRSYHQMYDTADADTLAVLVIRHAAIPLVLQDAIWAKYALGKQRKIKDPATDRWATRNPYLTVPAGAKDMHPDVSLAALQQRGAILLGCNIALMSVARGIAERTKQTPAAVSQELKEALIPGLVMQPSGIFATVRAQEAGAAFIRST